MESCDHREFGEATITVCKQGDKHLDALFEGIDGDMPVWMSHGDRLQSLPENFVIVAKTPSAPFAALAHKTKPIYGVQV